MSAANRSGKYDELLAVGDLRLDEDTLDAIDAVAPPGLNSDADLEAASARTVGEKKVPAERFSRPAG